MNKDDLEKLAGDPKFIPGIYNYCDRWCERCAFTTRCMNFELSEQEFSDPETRDINNKKFWDKINESFKAALTLLEAEAERLGIDLSDQEEGGGTEYYKETFEESEKHPLVSAARKYGEKVEQWFDDNENMLRDKATSLQQRIELDLPKDDPIEEAFELEDMIEIIRWYQYLISAKLFRAIGGKYNYNDFEDDPVKNDSNGSAKIGLISIERSLSAWHKMYDQFPEREDELIEMLLQLKRLLKASEKEFPRAYEFVRPGFDE